MGGLINTINKNIAFFDGWRAEGVIGDPHHIVALYYDDRCEFLFESNQSSRRMHTGNLPNEAIVKQLVRNTIRENNRGSK